MLPKKHRLKRGLFERVRGSRLVVSNGAGSFRFIPAPPPNKFSIVVSKNLIKGAVRRNTLRRFLYESLRGTDARLHGIFYPKTPQTTKGVARGLKELLNAATKKHKTTTHKKGPFEAKKPITQSLPQTS